MRFKIYEIDHIKDKDKISFMPLKTVDKVDPSIYKMTFDAEADISEPEDAFLLFNQEGHPLHNGHSMSVSDVIVMNNAAYYCDSFGFKKIEFNETMVDTSDLIRILYVQPHKAPYIAEIPNTLEAFQRAVGGYIDQVGNHDATAIICDENAKLHHKEGNRYLDGGGIVAGSFVIVGLGDEDWRSLTNEEIKRYSDKYAEAPDIPQKETDNDIGIEVFFE